MLIPMFAIYQLAITAIGIVAAPYMLGKPRPALGPGGLLFLLTNGACDIAIYGRVLGWW